MKRKENSNITQLSTVFKQLIILLEIVYISSYKKHSYFIQQWNSSYYKEKLLLAFVENESKKIQKIIFSLFFINIQYIYKLFYNCYIHSNKQIFTFYYIHTLTIQLYFLLHYYCSSIPNIDHILVQYVQYFQKCSTAPL